MNPAVIGVQVDVAAADDGDDVPPGEPVTILQNSGHPKSGRRFDDQTRVFQKHPDTRDDRRLADEDGVVGHREKVVQYRRDGNRPATPSAMVSVDSVVTTRRSCHERVIAGAPAGCTQITSTPGDRVFRT